MINAEDYFSQHEHNAGLCYQQEVAKVRRVQKGDKIYVNNFGLPIITEAEQDGWHAQIRDVHFFMGPEKFSAFIEEFKPVSGSDLGIEKQDLPQDATFTPVKKGERILVQPFSDSDLFVEDNASEDGYIVTLDGKKRYFSDFDFRSTFNVQAAPQNDDTQLYLYEIGTREKGAPYIVLTEDVTFDFAEEPHTAKAGSILVKNPNDIDGFTSYSVDVFEKEFTITKPYGSKNKAAPNMKP